MSTTIDGQISVNFGIDKNGFNAGECILSAFSKIKSNLPLTRHEEYAIEVLWHEILHNKSKNTKILPPIDALDKGFARVVAETINQLDARHSYSKFLQILQVEAKHQEWVLKHGYGYNDTVNNLRLLLKSARIDESDFVKKADKILMEDYTDIDISIRDLITEMNNNHNINAGKLFYMIEIKDFNRFLKVHN